MKFGRPIGAFCSLNDSRCTASQEGRLAYGSKMAPPRVVCADGVTAAMAANREEDRHERQRRNQGRRRFHQRGDERTREVPRQSEKGPGRPRPSKRRPRGGWQGSEDYPARHRSSGKVVKRRRKTESRPCECGGGRFISKWL